MLGVWERALTRACGPSDWPWSSYPGSLETSEVSKNILSI